MKNNRILLLLVYLSFALTLQTNLNAAEIGPQHTWGLGFLLNYEYEEPELMHLRAGAQATDDEFANIGFLYNYKKAFLTNNYLSEFEIDSSFQFLTQTYWSRSTGTMTDIDVEIFNLRALYGIQLSNKFMFKSGIGYRHLYHYWQSRQSTTGSYGYDREQDYTYIPLIAELKAPKGMLKIEYDHIVEGNHTAYQAYLGGTYKDLDLKNDNGYMWKISYVAKRKNFTFEPYYEFLSIEESNVVSGSLEPSNTTHELGIRVKREFNSNRSMVSNYKKVLSNDGFYFGLQLLMSEVESGFYSPTGTAKIEEEDTGFSIVSGMNIFDEIQGLPIKLDIEIAFNQFGDSVSSTNNGDTLTTDGRYRNGAYGAGSVVTDWVDNNDVKIESYSTSIGIKPSFKILNNLFINANLGFHRWDQSELDFTPSTVYYTNNYSGVDTYIGAGLSYKKNNISLEIEYLEHDMYYDAKSMGGELKYHF